MQNKGSKYRNPSKGPRETKSYHQPIHENNVSLEELLAASISKQTLKPDLPIASATDLNCNLSTSKQEKIHQSISTKE